MCCEGNSFTVAFLITPLGFQVDPCSPSLLSVPGSNSPLPRIDLWIHIWIDIHDISCCGVLAFSLFVLRNKADPKLMGVLSMNVERRTTRP